MFPNEELYFMFNMGLKGEISQKGEYAELGVGQSVVKGN